MNAMSQQEVTDLKQSSNWILKERMERARKEFGLDAAPQFAWHPWRGELVFSNQGAPKVVARIQVVGSLGVKGNVWTWGWARPDLLPSIRQGALRVRQYGEEHGVPFLIQPKWPAVEADGTQMMAIACKLLDAQGGVKCPGPEGTTFLVFTELRSAVDRKRVFGARACAHVLEQGRPILLLSRETDGEVLAVCGGEDDTPESTRSIPLDRLLNLDGSLADLADMPDGWAAFREAPDQEWARSKADA
jgi:hypothetical protein